MLINPVHKVISPPRFQGGENGRGGLSRGCVYLARVVSYRLCSLFCNVVHLCFIAQQIKLFLILPAK